MAGQGANSGGSGQRNRSHRPRPWIFPPPSVARPLLVRGPSPSSVARTAPESGAHGRIADGGGPESRLETRPCWSAARTSDRSDGL